MSCDRLFFYNRQLRPADVKAILYKKFYTVHDVRLVSLNKSLHLQVFYSRPLDPIRYEEEVTKITNKINTLQCSEFFITTVKNHPIYPDFLIVDGEVVDIPINIDLQADL